MDIEGSAFKVIIKPNSQNNEVVEFNKDKEAYLIKIKARAEDNKANIELIRFLSKMLGKKIKIKSGLKSRIKAIETYK